MKAHPERHRRSFKWRMRDQHLYETLFTSLVHAREAVAAWADDYNAERLHSLLGYATPTLQCSCVRGEMIRSR